MEVHGCIQVTLSWVNSCGKAEVVLFECCAETDGCAETKDGIGFDGCCVCAELDCGSSVV